MSYKGNNMEVRGMHPCSSETEVAERRQLCLPINYSWWRRQTTQCQCSLSYFYKNYKSVKGKSKAPHYPDSRKFANIEGSLIGSIQRKQDKISEMPAICVLDGNQITFVILWLALLKERKWGTRYERNEPEYEMFWLILAIWAMELLTLFISFVSLSLSQNFLIVYSEGIYQASTLSWCCRPTVVSQYMFI